MTTDDSKAITHRNAILFPHTCLVGSVRERILSAFDDLTICQAWYMDDPGPSDVGDAHIHVLWPPEALMPPDDFIKLLAEHRTWMSQNSGYVFLPVGGDEDATWEIRGALRHTDGHVRTSTQEQALKWHFILHLQRELEENHMAADEVLVRVKAKRSPLTEALGEATPSTGLLDDLPGFEPYPGMDGPRLKQVLKAWLGLFGPSLPKEGILVTMAREVFSYAEDLFGTDAVQLSLKGGAPPFSAIRLPASSDVRRKEKDPIYAGLSGKTLVLVDNG